MTLHIYIYIYRCMLFTMGEFVVEVGSACSKVRFLWSCRWRCFCPSGRDIPKELEGLQRSFEEKTVTWRIYWCALVYVDLYSFIWFMLIHLIYVDLCWFMLMYLDVSFFLGNEENGFWLHIKSASPFEKPSQPRSEFEGEILFSHKNNGNLKDDVPNFFQWPAMSVAGNPWRVWNAQTLVNQ